MTNLNRIASEIQHSVTLMEVCGTHTMNIFKHGIRAIIPENIKLISGPGCPVCVTPQGYIDQAIQLADYEDTITCTFGDMMRVPGEKGTLTGKKLDGADIRIVYSPMDCLKIAKDNPAKKVVFLGIGFETTAPVIGLAMKKAKEENIKNFLVLSEVKMLFPALKVLLESGETKVDGLICPGHVTSITGQSAYSFIPEKYKIPCVITGFESEEILEGIYMLVQQIVKKEALVQNAYKKAGTVEGNKTAVELINEVFVPEDSVWRGFGKIENSGLKPSEEYEYMDATLYYDLEKPTWDKDDKCRCGDIVRGMAMPSDCPLYRVACTPESPKGACMVSTEGTCATHYKYG